MKVYIVTAHSIHNNSETFNIIAASLDYNKAKNAMQTDCINTITNIYDKNYIAYSVNREDNIYTIQGRSVTDKHFDEWMIKSIELI